MGISLTSASRGQLPHTLSHLLLAVVLMCSSAVVDIVLSRSAPSPTLSLIYQQWCSYAHLLSWTSASRGLLPPPHTLSSTSRGAHALICCRGYHPLVVISLPPTLSHLPAVVLMRSSAAVGIVLSRSAPSHTLSHLPAVVLMCSSAVVDIVLSRSAPSPPPHTLSATSRGAHALICCRGHRPLVVCSLPTHTLSSTSRGAHALICCRGHPPLVVCPLPHALSHLLAVVLMCSSAVVDIGLSWSAPSQPLSSTSCGAHVLICCRGHRPLEVCSLTLSHLLAVMLMRTSAVVDILLSRSAPSPHTLSSTSCGALPSGVESSVSLALPRARE